MIETLAGVRALAIILVLCRHGIKGAVDKFNINVDSPFITFMINGWSGVDLFFVLSGFLIGFHLSKRWPDSQDKFKYFIRSYFYRRALRILPVYWCTIAIALLLPGSFYEIYSHTVAFDLLIHLVFLQDYLGANFVVALWSLATEFKYYLIAPLVSLLFLNLRSYKIIIAVLCLSFLTPCLQYMFLASEEQIQSYSQFFWTIRSPFHFAFTGLFLGGALAILYVRGIFEKLVNRKGGWVVVLSLVLLAVVLSNHDYTSDDADWSAVIVVLAITNFVYASFIVGAIYSTGIIKTILSSKLSHFISKISYPLYAIHMMIIPFSLEVSSSVWQFILIYFSLSIACAFAMHIFVEKPFLDLKRKV